MGDLIDRDALLEILEREYGSDDRSYDAAWALTATEKAPAVDAEPVRHGQWIGHTGQPGSGFVIGATYYTCSLCERVEEENGEPYCHCGAKMGVEEYDGVYGGAK